MNIIVFNYCISRYLNHCSVSNVFTVPTGAIFLFVNSCSTNIALYLYFAAKYIWIYSWYRIIVCVSQLCTPKCIQRNTNKVWGAMKRKLIFRTSSSFGGVFEWSSHLPSGLKLVMVLSFIIIHKRVINHDHSIWGRSSLNRWYVCINILCTNIILMYIHIYIYVYIIQYTYICIYIA